MPQPIRISIVSYLNSLPFLEGLRRAFSDEEILISEDIPSICAEKLINGQADVGLVPVTALDRIENSVTFSEYCIGCDGEVGSVLLVSENPVEQIESVLLDYQSRTSVRLIKVLFKDFWKKEVQYLETFPGYEEKIAGKTAGVIIGDRALNLDGKFKFVYDLGSEWKKLTGLPFVFATWTTRIPLKEEFIRRFNLAMKHGLEQRAALASKACSDSLSKETLLDYWTTKIRFDLGEKEKAGLSEFLKRIRD